MGCKQAGTRALAGTRPPRSNASMSEPMAPIGVLDSGFGGLSMLRAIGRRLPCEDLLYFADNAAMPFGEGTAAQVRARAEAVADALAAVVCKAVVIARKIGDRPRFSASAYVAQKWGRSPFFTVQVLLRR